MILDNIFQQLLSDEGVVLHPYHDSRGFLTIGAGHNLDAKPISHIAALVILNDDINDAKLELIARWPWMLTIGDARLGAFVNLVFNLGIAGVAGFKKAIAAAQAGQWDTVSAEILNSVYATQVGNRATRIAQQLRENRWITGT